MKKHLLIALPLIALVSVAAAWFWPTPEIPAGQAAMAEYRLENLSCGSCVSNIESALDELAGIGAVEINLTSHRGKVTFDPKQLDSATIAEAISAAGYPAQLRTELSPDELVALNQEQRLLGQQYLARIGDRLLTRSEFESIVTQRSQGTAPGRQPELRRAIWNELLQKELLLSAASANGILVQDTEIDARIAQLSKQHTGFEERIAKHYPDRESFRQLLREEMTIQRNLDRHVFAGSVSPQHKQQLFQQWFRELQGNTEVVIFDPEFKAASPGGSGCGGGCCG